jgi:hypothetical protein
MRHAAHDELMLSDAADMVRWRMASGRPVRRIR